MSSITSWARLEPRARSTSLSAVDARVYDPLWLLGRQWQVGEFTGEDAGSPISARLVAESGRLSRVAPGDCGAEPYDPIEMPLDVLVERESPHRKNETNVRLAVEIALAFWRELDSLSLGGRRSVYLKEYPLQRPASDAAHPSFADVMAERVPDGLALYADLRDRKVKQVVADRAAWPVEKIRALPEKAPEDVAIVRWLKWCGEEGIGTEPLSSWSDSRLEYAFAVGARLDSGIVALRANEYRGGGLDWFDFDCRESG